MMSRFKKLLLLPSLLLTSSLTHGEAIAPENREYFSTTMLSSVVGINDIEERCLPNRCSIKAQWYGEGSPEYVTCKNNQSIYTKNAMIVRLKQAWDEEEKKYEEHSAEWYDFKARVEGAKAEWYDEGSPEYAICKNNQSIYTKNAMIVRLKQAWDEEEKKYEKYSADWYDFGARVEGAKAEWYDEGSPEYVTCKNNQSICTKNAMIVRRRIMQEKKYAEWELEVKNYRQLSLEWLEFMARISGEEATWFDADTPQYASLIATRESYTARANAERSRRQQEEALAEQRQQRISVGRRQLQDANNGAIKELIQLIFERAGLSQLYPTLTDDDLAEITFYISDDVKNTLQGMQLNSFSYIDVSGRIVTGDWSTFADMTFAFYTFEDEAYFNYTSDTQPNAHIIASPEIEQFIESDLKDALKKLLHESLNDVIEQNWASVYVNFDPFYLNRIRNRLTAHDIAEAYIKVHYDDDIETLKAELLSNDWKTVSRLEVELRFFDFDKAKEEWKNVYRIGIDPDPKRPFDSHNPFTDIEVGSIATILQGVSGERESIKRLELIFSKERAQALFNTLMGEDDGNA